MGKQNRFMAKVSNQTFIRPEYLLLLLITLLATGLRFYKLGEWSFWSDEIITIQAAQKAFPESIFPAFIPTRGLSLLLIGPTLMLLGVSEWSARLVPTLIGVLTVPLMYFPVRKIFGQMTALIAILLLALSPWHLYWSQNARYYTSILLFYSLSMVLFYIGLEWNKPWYLLLAVVFFGFATWERLFALFLIPIFAGYLLLVPWLSGERIFKLQRQALSFLVIPLIILVVGFGLRGISGLPEFFELRAGFNFNSPFWVLSSVLFYLGVPLICAGFIGMLYLLSQRSRAGLLFSLGAIIPLAATLFLANFAYTTHRYVFVSLTSWIVLASAAISELLRHTQGKMRWLALMPLAMILLPFFSEDILYFQYQHGNRADWKAAFELIQEQKQPGDLVITAYPGIADYYMKEKTVDINDIDLSDLNQKKSRIWIVEDMKIVDNYSDFHDWILEHTRLVADFSIQVQAKKFHMKVFLFEPN